MQRIQWVDVYKGLAILSVVLGHSGSPISASIYSFHMAAFFFISGYTTRLERYSFSELLTRRVRTLLLPFLAFNALFIALWTISGALGGSKVFSVARVTPATFSAQIKSIVFFLNTPIEIGGATWFLIALFLAAILCKALHDFSQSCRWPSWSVLALLTPIFWYFLDQARGRVIWPYDIDIACIGAFFYYSGYLAREHRVLEDHIRTFYAAPLSFLGLAAFNSLYWVQVNFPGREFSSFWNLVLASSCGTYALYWLATTLTRFQLLRRLLSRIGQESLAILAFHFLGFKLAFFALFLAGESPFSQMTSIVPERSLNGFWMLFTTVAVVFSLGAAWVIRRNPLTGEIFFGQRSPANASEAPLPANGNSDC